MTIDKKIWNVESTCDGEHNSEIYFTLSFVTPTLNEPESFEGIIIPLDWHLPYKIDIGLDSKWKLVYFDQTIENVEATEITNNSKVNSELDNIRVIFETKLKDAIQNQTKPYSTDSLIASRQETGKSTLPHELAGLNQLPKPLSEFLFEATVTVKFDKNKLNLPQNPKIIGLYPAELKIQNETFKFKSTTTQEQNFKDPKIPPRKILHVEYTSNSTSLPLVFKDIIQQDTTNTPESAPNSFDGSSLVFLNDPSVSGRLAVLARNLNSFRMLSDLLNSIKTKEKTTVDKKVVLELIYKLLLRGILREDVIDTRQYTESTLLKRFKWWLSALLDKNKGKIRVFSTAFDSNFATNLNLGDQDLDNLAKVIAENEIELPQNNWFEEHSNPLNKSWLKLGDNPSLIDLATFFEDLANESIKSINESSFWVDWLYFANKNSIETYKLPEEQIKSLIKKRLEDAHIRDRLILRPFFKEIGEDAPSIFKSEILARNPAPKSDDIKKLLEDENKLKPIVSLFIPISKILKIDDKDAPNYEDNIKNICLDSLVTTVNQIYDQASALPDDWDISIRIEDNNSKNKDIRGYNIALCSVDPSNKVSILESVWLTNRKVIWQDKLEKKLLQSNGSDLIVDRPHGGFKSQGEQVLSINYYGDGTGLSESDRSDKLNTAIRFVSLDVDEKEEKKISQSIYPKLGYGMCYKSAVTSILNSGLVVEQSFRDSKQDIGIYTLKKSSEITYEEEPKQYLCRVKPAAPNILSYKGCNINEDKELSRDSLATLVHKNSINQNKNSNINPPIQNSQSNPPIFLLSQTDNQFWNKKTRTLELTIDRPRTSYNVFERWINTELVYVQKDVDNKYRDPYFKKKSVEELNDLLAKFPRKSLGEKDASLPPHPAVRAIGIKLFNAITESPINGDFIIDDYEKYLDKIILKATYTTSSSKEDVKCDNSVINISLAPDNIYRICLYSLVPKNLCDGDLARVRNEILKDTEKKLVHWNDKYYQGAESEFWIECLAREATVSETTIDNLLKKVYVNPTSSLVSLNVAELDSISARLFSGLEFEQHKWRWTGYPSEIDIAKGDGSQDEQLNLRLMDYWGARSRHYEKIEKDAKNQTQLDGHWQVSFENNDFKVNPQKLHDWYFKGNHGAHHGVYLLKPRLRYQGLIEGNQLRAIKTIINKICYQNINVKPFLVNAVLPIHDHNFKLPPLKIAYSAPVLEWDKPSSSNSNLVHAGSCEMCVFDEVFYRNDDMGLFGCLAERYEISLVPTRIKGLHQIGPDPVFHPQPNVKKFTKNDKDKELYAELNLPYLTNNIPKDDLLNQLNWKVEHTPFYGLTNDGGINHKNNQTATNLYLSGNFTHQYDILAQVRTRRWLEPTLVEGAEIKVGANAKFLLPKRFDKQDWVPIDYCVFDGKNKRVLVSWHKGMWNNTSEEIWRRNIISQELTITNLGQDFKWLTTSEKTPYEDNLIYTGQSDANHWELSEIYHHITSNIKVFKWITSDYSDGTWMTFLRSPWRNQSFASKSFGLLYANEKIKIKRSSLSYENNKLEAKNDFIVEDLIIHPLIDSYCFGTNEQWLNEEKHRFNLLFVYETFKPEDQADSDEKYCKFHSLWHPTRVLNQATKSPSKLIFVPIDNGTELKEGNNYIGALYEFYCENIEDEITKKIKNYLLGFDKNGKKLKVNENGIERLKKLWFPEMQGENTARPLVIMRPPMMGYMPLFFGVKDLNEALKSEVHENTAIKKYKIKYNDSMKVYFEIYINKADSFWEIYYKSKNIPKNCSIAEATRGFIVVTGSDICCMNPNGNAVIKLKNIDQNDKNPSVEVIQNSKWATNWAVDLPRISRKDI